MKFPEYRLRRLRKTENLRLMFAETEPFRLTDLIMPYFVIEGKNIKQQIELMPGTFRFSIDKLLKEVKETYNLGIPAVLIFGIPNKKDEFARQAYEKDGIVQKAIKEIKNKIPEIVVITDVCLCSYTIHGHCGILKSVNKTLTRSPAYSLNHYIIDNDVTLDILAKIALSHAEAGADIVAPSAMMDGQVKAIRGALDNAGYEDIAIMSYSAKFASNFYGPFREAAESSPKFGNRKTYQMDFHNLKEALREVEQDIEEGADIVMVKPALAYLDVIRAVKEKFNIPLTAFNVSGEYTMLKAYCKQLNKAEQLKTEKNLVIEILTAIKRAGADIIITYWAKEVAKCLKA